MCKLTANKNTGNKGEDIAADWLLQKNYTVIERNWRHKHWEVDIIAHKDGKLHFVEVKTRTSYKFGKPEESISNAKMTCLKNAAEEYLYQHKQWTRIEFDVIAITIKGGELKEVFWIEDVYF